MSATDTIRSVISHRGMSCLELHRKLGELTRQVARLAPRAERTTALQARIDEQALTIGSLREQLTKAKTIRADVNAKYGRYEEAEARADAAEKRLAETVARIDEQHAQTVRGMERQLAELVRRLELRSLTDATVTETQELDADEIQKHCTPVPLHQSPLADPAHVPAWAVRP